VEEQKGPYEKSNRFPLCDAITVAILRRHYEEAPKSEIISDLSATVIYELTEILPERFITRSSPSDYPQLRELLQDREPGTTHRANGSGSEIRMGLEQCCR